MVKNTAELQVLEGNNQFTINLYKVLSRKKGNVFFSPISVHAVLSMAYQGAQGSTAEKFASTLLVPQAKSAAKGYNAVMNRLNSVPNVTLLMANKIFLMEGQKMLSNFEKAVRKSFLSEVQQVNFGQSVASAQIINHWVAEKTNEKIKNLISKDDIDASTRLVLVNAIYFKGNWKNKFNKNATRTEPFYLNDVDTVDVQMMHTQKKFNYKFDEALDAQILKMPYTNEDLSMIIILPSKRNGIAELEKKLTTANLTEITNRMWNTEVIVSLPRFKVEQTIDLKASLTALGLGEIFDKEKANFRGMIKLNPNENLYVSRVVQKAFIEVNEEGAEAAAATVLRIIFGVLLTSITMAENTAELQVLQGNNQFTINLYKALSRKEGNVFFSPISIHAVLSMAYQGAQGSTAEKFASTLQVPQAKSAAKGYNAVMNRLNSVPNVTLLMANKVFLMEGKKMLTNFETAVRKNFLSEVQQVNFAQSEAAAKTINGWVEEKTQEKIKDLISKDDLNALTRLVLVNAIYFKGNWKHKFDKEDTYTEPFYLNDVDTVDVQMMHTEEKFNYKFDEALDAQILEMPYTNEDLSIIIILPNKRNGIAELEKKLATANLAEITNHMWNTEVTVSLPRFRVEQTIDLQDSLTELGLGEIFDEEKANFRGMIELDPKENLYVSKAVQKAFIEVNEEGAEAAAATGLIMRAGCCLVPSPTPEFKADHPFIYILSEKRANQLFAGRLSKPDNF